MGSQNIRPVHKNFQNVESNSTHTVGYAFYTATINKGFAGFQNIETSSTHTVGYMSGYKYTGSAGIAHPFTEKSPIYDSLAKVITKHFTESCPVDEFFFTGNNSKDEPLPIKDDFNIIMYKSFTEKLAAYDDTDAKNYFDERYAIKDDWNKVVYRTFDQPLGISESEREVFIPIRDIYTNCIKVSPYVLDKYTLCVEFAAYHKDLYSTNIAVVPHDLAPVTTIGSNSENPFKPTIVVDDVVIISHPETLL